MYFPYNQPKSVFFLLLIIVILSGQSVDICRKSLIFVSNYVTNYKL